MYFFTGVAEPEDKHRSNMRQPNKEAAQKKIRGNNHPESFHPSPGDSDDELFNRHGRTVMYVNGMREINLGIALAATDVVAFCGAEDVRIVCGRFFL